ncbi:MAG: hypothetical protein V3V25_06950 [Paracoccaceae bacterium]
MEEKSIDNARKKPAAIRQDRLKSALKANLKRRKAQARVRKSADQQKG